MSIEIKVKYDNYDNIKEQTLLQGELAFCKTTNNSFITIVGNQDNIILKKAPELGFNIIFDEQTTYIFGSPENGATNMPYETINITEKEEF